MMVLRDLHCTGIPRQGNNDYTRAPAIAEYPVNHTGNSIEEAVHAEERFRSCQDLSAMAMGNLLSKVATIILRNWKAAQQGGSENDVDCVQNFIEEVVYTREGFQSCQGLYATAL